MFCTAQREFCLYIQEDKFLKISNINNVDNGKKTLSTQKLYNPITGIEQKTLED